MTDLQPDQDPGHAHGHAHGDGHGDPDPEFRARPLAQAILALGAVILFTAFVMWFVVRALVRDEPVDQSADRGGLESAASQSTAGERLDRSRPVGPLLQPRPPEDMEELRRWESSVLDSYGWSDRSSGLVRVPVEDAARRVAESGLPKFTEGSP